jgi:hypothetical protein
MMSETLVVIRTFEDLLSADEAQLELLNAGIHSLLLAEQNPQIAVAAESEEVALAVHRRDAEVANALLAPLPDTS